MATKKTEHRVLLPYVKPTSFTVEEVIAVIDKYRDARLKREAEERRAKRRAKRAARNCG